MGEDIQFMLGKIIATQELILKEIQDQKVRVGKLETKVNYWAGGLAVLLAVWAVVSDSVVKTIGLK